MYYCNYMLTHNKYTNQMRDIMKINKSKKIMDEFKFNKNIDGSNNYLDTEEETISTIYDTTRVITNTNKYRVDRDIKKYIPRPIEFAGIINTYNTNNLNKLYDEDSLNSNHEETRNTNPDNVFIVMYYVNTTTIPFMMLYMINDTMNNVYSFPQLNVNNKLCEDRDIKEYDIEISKYIKEIYKYESIVKSIKNYNNKTYIFSEIKMIGNVNSFNKGMWALPHELINEKKLLNVNISNNNYEFLVNHIHCIIFYKHEQPIVAYQCIINDSEVGIFYTLDNLKKIISNKISKDINIKIYRFALFIGKLKVNNKDDMICFSDCNSIYKYDKNRKLSMILIKNNKQQLYLSTHQLDDFA